MFLHGETGRRLRQSAAILTASILSFAALATTAGATDARHYEQVSPVDKGQGDIVSDGQATVAARLGDAVELSSRTPFGDEIGSGVAGQTQYVVRRTSDGWAAHAITPKSRTDAFQTFFTATKFGSFSDDLTRLIVWGYDLPGGGGTPARNNVYEEDATTRSLQALTLSQAAPLAPLDFVATTEWGTSADARHVALVTSTQLLPDATAGRPNVYQWDAGRGLSLAGVLPDGSVPATGSRVLPINYRGAMSADGSRLVFTAVPNDDPGGDQELYMRIDGSLTVPISTPPGSPTFSANVHLEAVTPDGRNVFFGTDTPLLPGDAVGGTYRWTDSGDPAHDGVLTQIVPNLNPSATTTGVVGVSDDGSRVYFHTGGNALGVWDNGSATTISTSVVPDPAPRRSLAAVASQPGYGRVTPDGMWLAFVSSATAGNDGIHALSPQGQVSNGHYEMYLYSLRDHTLNCVSCPPGPATSDASVLPDATSGTPQTIFNAIRPRFLSDGGQVYFSTSDALVPEDVNGVEDVYEFDGADGTLRLVSTGTGKQVASFAEAGASGADVFIETRQQLVPGDQDQLVDMYDATTRPPLAIPQPAPTADCQGDTCQPPPSASPPEDLFGSLALDGSGNSTSVGKALTIPSSVTARGSVASVRVRLGAAGTLSWRGSGVQSGSAKHGSGSVTVRVRLDRRARAQLKRKGRYVTRVRLTLVQKDGTRASGIVRVTFRAAAKKGR